MSEHVQHDAEYYIAYLSRRPLSLDLCYLIELAGEISPGEAARQLGLAIQTTSNSLRDLESVGILKSVKTGRERKYLPKDQLVFHQTMSMASSLLASKAGKRRFKGRIFPLETLLSNVTKELVKKKVGVLERDIAVDTPLTTIKIDIQIKKKSDAVWAVIISHVEDRRTLLMTLGRLLCLSTRTDLFSYVLLVSLFNKGYWDARMLSVTDVVESLFKIKLSTIEDTVDDFMLIAPQYGKRLAQRIAESVGAS